MITVSVVMITYNHEKYIAQAIEGVLSQKTNFSFELIIADDASTDSNQEIIREYKNKEPEIIFPILRKLNLGGQLNVCDAIKQSNGKYIALCEGDDYWTDLFKLQMQVDFLEANPDYSLCFHNAVVLWENNSIAAYDFCKDLRKTEFDTFDVINSYFIPTASIVFRSQNITPFPVWFSESSSGDYALHLLCSIHGKIKYVDQNLAVYRRTVGTDSMTSNYNTLKNIDGLIVLFKVFNSFTNYRYSSNIRNRIFRLKIERYILAQKFKFPKIWKSSKRLKDYLKSEIKFVFSKI